MSRRQKCGWCDQPAAYLCDALVPPRGLGIGPRPKETCDAPMCDAHAAHVGMMFFDGRDKAGRPKGWADTVDHCPDHVRRGAGPRKGGAA